MAVLGHQHHKPFGHDARNAFAQADVGQQLAAGAVAGKAQQPFPDLLVAVVLRGQLLHAFGAQGLGQQFFAQVFGFGLGQGF